MKQDKIRIYRFFGEVFLWLIVCFIAWFLTARILNIPLVWLSDFILGWLSDDTFTKAYLHFSEGEFKLINQQLVLETNIPPPGDQPVLRQLAHYCMVMALRCLRR